MNLHGYPGMFRELNEPPPSIEVTLEDINGSLPPACEKELRPFYLYIDETSPSDLVRRFMDHHAELIDRMTTTGMSLQLPDSAESLAIELFEEKIQLARCLGTTDFESLYEAVFDFDEITPTSRAPDLFAWDQDEELWFFCEVKGPNDHLRRNQAEWVQANWDKIKGRFDLLVVSPDA